MVHPDLPLSARWVRFYSRNRLRIREKENAALLRENNRPRGGATKRGYFYLHSSVRPSVFCSAYPTVQRVTGSLEPTQGDETGTPWITGQSHTDYRQFGILGMGEETGALRGNLDAQGERAHRRRRRTTKPPCPTTITILLIIIIIHNI